ncbi:hypothetical protein HN385_07965 [archaeon]|nr:hypothetical protein [archaeon]
MFREHLEMINEAVLEGSNKGIESFLETLDKDLKMDEIIEESGGVDAMMQQLFVENGFSVTEIDEDAEVLAEDQEAPETPENLEETDDGLDETLETKIDSILENLKEEGLVE